MAINSTCQESEIQAAIDNLTSSCESTTFLETALAADGFDTNRKFSIALGCDLPDLCTATISNGTMIFVEEDRIPVVASNCAWIGVDGRLYRQDTAVGELYNWGYNSRGQLGRGTTASTLPIGKELYCDTSWKDGAPAWFSTHALKFDGTIWSAGYDAQGQLGDGAGCTPDAASYVQEFYSSTDWCVITASEYKVAAIKTNGTLWTWGCGSWGNSSSGLPTQEPTSATDWKYIQRGSDHSVALKNDNSMFLSGGNGSGQLGTNDTTTYGLVQEVTSSTDWCFVTSGTSHTLAIKNDNSLWVWGSNSCGQLGMDNISNYSSPVQEYTSSGWCGASGNCLHSLGIKTDGTLWAWGEGTYGQLGVGTVGGGTNVSSPVQEITSSTNWTCVAGPTRGSYGIKSDGTLWSWGEHRFCSLPSASGSSYVCLSTPVQELCGFTSWSKVCGSLFASALGAGPHMGFVLDARTPR